MFSFFGAAVGLWYCVVTADAPGGCVVNSRVNLDIAVVGGFSGVAPGSGATVSSSVNPGTVGGVVVCGCL